MKNKFRSVSTFKIAATYIGTVVGAGFASGQEVLQFFSFFGIYSLPALVLSGLLFILFGYIIMELGQRLNAKSHLSVIRYSGGPWLGRVIDTTITFFLFGALSTMAAGAGAIFAEQFGLSSTLGSVVMVAASLGTVLTGIAGVITAISFVVPVLLFSVISLSIATLVTNGLDLGMIRGFTQPFEAPLPFWPFSSIAYASYNLVLSVAILAPLGRLVTQDNRNTLKKGALYGGIGLAVGVLFINLALLSRPFEAATFEVPMIFIAGQFSPLIQIGYAVVLLAEIYTTAVANLYGFASRFIDPDTAAYKWMAIGTAGAAFVTSLFGFSNLVGILYPAVGVAGILMLGGLAVGYFREHWILQPQGET
ncbi:MAG: hypothetical protein H0Z39_01430 [Peptococcaceae bacterium]|nr:hypothetical protein [Peptococcaceae bacterium]